MISKCPFCGEDNFKGVCSFCGYSLEEENRINNDYSPSHATVINECNHDENHHINENRNPYHVNECAHGDDHAINSNNINNINNTNNFSNQNNIPNPNSNIITNRIHSINSNISYNVSNIKFLIVAIITMGISSILSIIFCVLGMKNDEKNVRVYRVLLVLNIIYLFVKIVPLFFGIIIAIFDFM